MVQIDFPAYALSIHKQNALSITKGNNPSPFYSNTNVHLIEISVFAKVDEIPSLPVQCTEENPKCCGQRITKCNNSNKIGP